MDEIFGLWNNHYNSTTLLNLPRLFVTLPSYLISLVFGAEWLSKSFILFLSFTAMYSQFYFSSEFLKRYLKVRNIKVVFVCAYFSSLVYAFNPWFILRIQHTYLLCGYSLFPMLVHYYLRIFNENYCEDRVPVLEYVKFSLLFSLSSAAIHYFFFSALFIGFLFVAGLAKKTLLNSDNRILKLRKEIEKLLLLGFFTFLGSLYWLGPYLIATLTGKMSEQANINVLETLSMFSRESHLWNVVSMNSYWWTMMDQSLLSFQNYFSWLVFLSTVFAGVLVFFRKNSVVQLFVVFTVLTIILATGSYYEYLASIHEFFVFRIPVVGKIFRDPNKLVGLLAFFYSTFFCLGLCYFLLKLFRKHLQLLISTIGLLSVIFSFLPYYQGFLLNFYSPQKPPMEWAGIQRKVNINKNKAMFLPQAEDRVDSSLRVASLEWNPNRLHSNKGKSVGDITLYGSKKDTTFQYEGNHPIIGYHYSFMQNLLDSGRTIKLKSFSEAFFSDTILYQKGFSSFAETEKFNELSLAQQEGVRLVDKSRFLNSYRIEDMTERSVEQYSNVLLSVGGLESFTFFQHTPYSIDNYNIAYLNQKDNNLEKFKNVNTTYDFRFLQDVVLSQVPSSYDLPFFEQVNRSAPFMTWSKTSIYKEEWRWFHKSLNIEFRNHPILKSGGALVTYADAKLDVLPSQIPNLKGEVYETLESLINTKELFLENESPVIQVHSFPKSGSSRASVMGTVQPGEVSDIWKIAKTRLISVKERNPYSILTEFSGRNSESVHIKFHFYNSKLNEIGVAYISRPDQTPNPDNVKFKTLFVTPKSAIFMRAEVLSSSKPSARISWWLHGFTIEDLGKYKKSNSVELTRKLKVGERYIAFANIFKSPSGGQLNFSFNDVHKNIQTRTSKEAMFQWFNLGEFVPNSSQVSFSVLNESGFNSISSFIVIPINEYKKIKTNVLDYLNSGERLISFEAETDLFDSFGKYSLRNYLEFSNGKGASVFDKTLVGKFDLVKGRELSLSVRGMNMAEYPLSIEVRGGPISFRLRQSSQLKLPNISQFSSRNKDSNYYEYHKFSEPRSFSEYKFQPIYLDKGSYSLHIRNLKPPENLTGLSKVQKLYTQLDEIVDPQALKVCCECGYDEDMKEGLTSEYKRWEVYSLNSCQWHILQTNVIDIHHTDEFYLEYDFYFKNSRNVHQKVLFLDENDTEIGKLFIDQSSFRKENVWHNSRELFTPPRGAKKLLVLFLFKGKFEHLNSFLLRNVNLVNASRIPLVDNLYFHENKFLSSEKKKILFSSEDNMLKAYQPSSTDNKTTLRHGLVFNKLWRAKETGRAMNKVVFNGFSLGLVAPENSPLLTLDIPLRFFYFLGLIVYLILLLYLFYKTKLFAFVSIQVRKLIKF